MNIDNLRAAFTIYYYDPSSERSDFVEKSLQNRDYAVVSYNRLNGILNNIKLNPPHIIFFNLSLMEEGNEDLFKKIKEISPETRIIVVASKADFSSAYAHFEEGVFDFIFSDYFSEQSDLSDRKIVLANIIKTADHAVEMDCFKYKNEQLTEDADTTKASDSYSVFILHNIWLKKLEKCQSFTQSIDCFMGEVCRYLKSTQVCYLKYVASYRSLVTSRAQNIEGFTVGETFNLRPIFENPQFNEQNLETNGKFRDLFKSYTGWKDFAIVPLRIDGDLLGVFLINIQEANEANSYILACINSLALKVSNIVLEKRMNTINHKDTVTGLFNRRYLMGRLQEEVSRARRINLPISFLLISFDRFGQFIEENSPYETNGILRLTAKLLDQTSRINDIVGRISSDEFGIILPHTPYRGALVKAERIRALISSTDYSSISPKVNQVTVSVGVCEYPSHCRDMEDMLGKSDNAMLEVSRNGGNQVCLTSTPKSFKPDFSYK